MRVEEEEKMQWRLNQREETETLEIRVVSDGVEGVHLDFNGECHHESDAPGEECEKIRARR